jgi:acetate kinase
MKILVLNCGSSSVKYKLYDITAEAASVLAQGGVEKLGLKGSFLKFTLPEGEKRILERDMPEHTAAIEFILGVLTGKEYGCLSALADIEAVGHRVVHGGEHFSASVVVTPEVKARLAACNSLAPLHNPPNLKGIEAMERLLPDVPQVAVFDTAFHQTMPPRAYMYGLPHAFYEKYGIRRYGFHGTSHRYVSRRAAEFLGRDYTSQRIITAHIGNGGSVAAIRGGECVDTSMGLTPAEGLLMGTRCGDIDAGALAFLMEKEGLTPTGLSDLINKQSGVLGLSGVSSDMRDIEEAIRKGNTRAQLALEVYNYRIRKYVGAYAAALGGCDILAFTGGVGENQWSTRHAVCEGMEFMGILLDEEKNRLVRGEEQIISRPESKTAVLVIPTDEELTIASDTLALTNERS